MQAATSKVAEFLGGPLVVSEPDVAGPLAVYPILGPPVAQAFVAFSDAESGSETTLTELEASASVRDLAITNLGHAPVLLYEGEEILGGQQNRSVDVAVLIGVGMKVTIPVTCVEQGRWDGSRHRSAFQSAPHAGSPGFRAMKSRDVHERRIQGLEGRADQSASWSMVNSIFLRFGARSPTEAVSDVYEQKRKELNDLERRIHRHDGQLGALVAIGETFRVLDFVGSADVFAALHGRLVRGYALDALENPEAAPPSIDEARAFVHRVTGAKVEDHEAVGLGRDLRFAEDGIAGSGLENEGELVQLTAFPTDGTAPETTADPAVRGAAIRRPSLRRH